MELILTLVMWGILLFFLFALPRFLIGLIPGQRLRFGVSLLCVFVVCVLLFRPPVIVSEECSPFVSVEMEEQIRAANRGIYSLYIPFFPVYIDVKDASEQVIQVETKYFPFGSTEMSFCIEENGVLPSLERKIFGYD